MAPKSGKRFSGRSPSAAKKNPAKKTRKVKTPISDAKIDNSNAEKAVKIIEEEKAVMVDEGNVVKVEEEEVAKAEAEKVVKAEAERIAKAEAERVSKAEEERVAKAEAERIAKAEAERVAKAEAEKVAKAEAEKVVKAKVEKVVKAEAEKVVKDNTEMVVMITEDVSPSEEDKMAVSKVDMIKAEGNTIVLDSEFVPKIEVEEGMKDTFDEEDKGERLELDDNDVEYEHDEDQGIDYDGKDVENAVEIQEGDEYEDVEVEGEDDMNEKFEDEDEDVDNGDDENEEEHEIDRADEEHQDFVRELRKRKEFELFVGGLDKNATEADLRKVFSEAGEITEVRLMMNPQTNKNKGFAFLRFATVEAAKRAATELKNPVINGKQCGVSPSQDSDTLFLGNISKAWSKEELKKKLKHYGIENVDDLTLVEDTNNKGMNRGFCFLEFSSRANAMNAYRRLQRRDVVFGIDRSAKVAFADTFIEPDDEIMTQVTTVFIDGLSSAWDEDCLKGYLKKFGAIEKIELARNMPSAKRKDFGFVTFDSHDAAVACADGINNAELGEGDTKAKVRSRLSRPHQRGRGKGTRGGHKISRGASLGGRSSRSKRRSPPKFSSRSSRSIGVRGYGFKRSIRERRPAIPAVSRVRPMPPPGRAFTRRLPVSSYPKNNSKWDVGRRNEMSSRSRASVEYDFGFPSERRHSYIDEYSSRGSGYSDVSPRAISRAAPKRAYEDEPYGRKFERPHSYRESRANDYYSFPGSKRPYSVVDDPSPRYSDLNLRHSRTRMDYGISEGSQYVDSHGERSRRSHLGYGSSRGALSGHEPREFYSGGRQGMDYDIGFMRSNVGGMYPSSFGGGYMTRGSDVGGGSYSSMYSGRSLSGSGGYMGGNDSGSYY